MNIRLPITVAFAAAALTMNISMAGTQPATAEPSAADGMGPRGPVGPDVALNDAEKQRFARSITVEGRTAAAVQAACQSATSNGRHVVFLPTGEYLFAEEVRVPGGVTLLGEGARTLIRAQKQNTHLFRVDGDQVRFTRLKLQGADTTTSQTNNTYGISASRKQNIRIDHCELLGFSYATTFSDETAAQVDHCLIHHNLRDGLGYGVAIYSGAFVLVTDNEFSQNRHSLASNGALDWNSGERLGRYVHKTGVRRSHWEFLHNRVGSNDLSTYELCAVDTHPGMDGSFVVEENLFENLRHGIGIRDGMGLICSNYFRNLRSLKPGRPVMAISIGYGTHNNVPVEGCMPCDVQVAHNLFESGAGRVFTDAIVSESAEIPDLSKYRIGKAENITIDGKLVPETRKEQNASPEMPRLQEMNDGGILRIRPALH